MSKKIKQCFLLIVWVFSVLASDWSRATNELELASAVLPPLSAPDAFSPTPFATINFNAPFPNGVVPHVYTIATEDGADPCTLRIRNVTNTGFDVTCLEPISEDRSHPGMVFDYIAIQPGGVTVPDDGTDTVEFVSECVFTNRQVYGPACAGCAGAQSYLSVLFPVAFANTPKLIAKLQTTNNLQAGEPIFIDVAVRDIVANGFRVAIDSMEAGVGAPANDEQICYLAVDSSGCRTLDLSGLGGPAAVAFQAVNASNMDGHGNGCNAGEGANFAGGCFTNTPIAVSHLNSRNGNNGGWLRTCVVSTADIRLTVDEDTVSNGERNHIDEIGSVFAFGSAFTTPVTLARAKVVQLGRTAWFDWQTSSEVFHLGFHLWGETDNGWVQLNRRLIVSNESVSQQQRRYRQRVRLTRSQAREIRRFGISSVDITGHEEFYGPFESDIEYGAQSTPEPIDWQAQRQHYEQRMLSAGFRQYRGRWIRSRKPIQAPDKAPSSNAQTAYLDVRFEGDGLHRISGQQLLQMMPEWRRMPIRKLAVSLNGEPVPRWVRSDDRRLSEDDQIVFAVKTPVGDDGIYLSQYNYRLSRDWQQARPAASFSNNPAADVNALATLGLNQQTLSKDAFYSAIIGQRTPWYDRRLLAIGTPAVANYLFELSEVAATHDATLNLVMHGSVDFPGKTPDHHVQIRLNGELLHDAYFDGLTEYQRLISLPAEHLQAGQNTLSLHVPNDAGYQADLVLVDELTISNLEALVAGESMLFHEREGVNGYRIQLNNRSNLSAFVHASNGALGTLPLTLRQDDIVIPSVSHQFSAVTPDQLRYWIGDPEQLPQWESAVRGNVSEPALETTNYLIVTDAAFQGDTLNQFVEFKQQQGYKVSIVTWQDLVDRHGFGNNTPMALDDFLTQYATMLGVEYVLLVGGHTFDYRGLSNPDTLNFIPAFYRSISIFKRAPTDNPYADLDGDGMPELKIGRWPVRDQADLKAIVDKTLDWESRPVPVERSAVLIAQQNDARNLDFAAQMEGRVAVPLAQLGVNTIDRIYLGQENTISLHELQTRLRNLINNGVDLVSFNGHGSPIAWGFNNLVNTAFIHSLENTERPTVVMPLACYTTNYENNVSNSLAYQWLFSADKGAVAVHGASVLGEYRENGITAERFLKASVNSKTYGEALLKAKQGMGNQNQMLNNWVFLGDPSLSLIHR